MKKTAVEWLANEIQEQLNMFFPGATLYQPTIDKAKEMEKEQIIEAYETAMETDIYNEPLKIGKDYFNQTFKSE
jgi:hypothetical protein